MAKTQFFPKWDFTTNQISLTPFSTAKTTPQVAPVAQPLPTVAPTATVAPAPATSPVVAPTAPVQPPTVELGAKTFTTPGGAIVDELGNIITAAPTPAFTADLPDTIPDTTISAIMKAPASRFDLEQRITTAEQDRIAQEQRVLDVAARAATLKAPTEEERTLTQNLLELRGAAAVAGEAALRSGDTLSFAAGEASRVNRDAAIRILGASESLRAITGIREAELGAEIAQLGVEDTRLERLLGVEDSFKQLRVEQKEEARDMLSTILDLTTGSDFDDVDQTTRDSITKSAQLIGLPIDAIKIAMKNAKLATMEDASKTLTELAELGIEQAAIADSLGETVNNLNAVIKSPGLSAAVGPSKVARSSKLWKSLTGQTQNFIAGVEQIISQKTMDTLTELKARGGTLGALSDQERIMLASAASKIGTWRITNKNNQVVGYNSSEKDFITELNTIKRLTNKAIKNAGGTIPAEMGGEGVPEDAIFIQTSVGEINPNF